MEVTPRNTVERLYTVFVLLGAMVTFSTFVSSITSAMTTLRAKKSEQSKQAENLRRYISDNHVSIELARRISAYISSHNLIIRQRVHEEDIKALKALPEVLQAQLHWEVYSGRLVAHPVFHQLSVVSNVVSDVCHRAMSEKSLYPTQDLFLATAKAESAFLIHAGILKYVICNGTAERTVDVEAQWVCEVALWIKWVHLGRLSASTNCELLVLDATCFRRIGSEDPRIHGALCEYARKYREHALGGGIQHPLEVWYEFDKTQELAQDSFSELEAATFVRPSLRSNGNTSSGGFLPGLWRSIS